MKILSFTCALAFCASTSQAQATLEILEPTASGAPLIPYGIDFDGNSIAGTVALPSSIRAALWTASDGIVLLPAPTPTATMIEATGISASGEVVVGEYRELGAPRGFRWTPAGGSQGLGTLPAAIPAVLTKAVSADGRVVVGGVTNAPFAPVPFSPYRWTTAGGFDLISVPGTGTFSISATAVNADGMRVGGEINQIPSGVDGFAYVEGVPASLLSTSSGSPFHEVDAFSADGSVLVGSASDPDSTSRPILWTELGGVEDIPLPAPASWYARFMSVSGDGEVVIGRYAGPTAALGGTFLWRRGDPSSVDLGDLLVAQGVPGADVLEFTQSSYLSMDGRVIAGTAADTLAGKTVAYRITLKPSAPSVLSSTFCASQPPNSVGAVASLQAAGTIDASLNALELLAIDLPPGQFGYFLASGTPTAGSTVPGSMGSLCLGGTLRALVMTLVNIDSSGTVREFVDQDTLPSAMVVTVGSTLHFQGWYRDVGPTSRFTQAASVTFQ